MRISVSNSGDIVQFSEVEVTNLEELAEIVLKKNFSPGIYKDGYRCLENFIQAECIGLDIDNDGKRGTPELSLEEAKDAFKDYTHLILPTKSHQKPKHGRIKDRYRVILFFTEPISDIETFYSTWHSLKEKFPAIDNACKDPSRFFYPSKSIASKKRGGKKIEPIRPAPKKEKKPVDQATLLPGDRGILSKETRRLLVEGIETGGRNHATYKIAKEFQQNLYPLEEALDQIVTALKLNGTIAFDFSEEEVEQTIRSAYNGDPKHEPRIEPRAFRLQTIGELYRDKTEMDWLVEELFPVGGVSLISAEPKAGKSTLVRQLIRDVLRGGIFLGRRCKQGSVMLFAIEEQIQVLNTSFKRLGVTDDEPLLVHVGDPLTDNKFDDLKEILVTLKPALVVIDTMFDMLDVESENNYKEVKRELRKFRGIARESGSHIVFIHHNSKGSKDDRYRGNRAILGSTAISGAMDTVMVIEIEGDSRYVTTSGREVRRWVKREIVFDKKDRTYSLGPETEEF